MKLSIIIPVFNEERTIVELLKRVSKASIPNGVQKEIVVVNDGSTDRTKILLEKASKKNLLVINSGKNQGKGAAVRKGLDTVDGDIILIQDADLEYNPNDYIRLVEPILSNKTEVVYGTRFENYPLKLFGKSRTPLPSHWLGNKILTLVTNILYGSNITDMETCYKVFTKKVKKSLNLKSKRFEIEPEITSKILKLGYHILEVPIKVKPRSHKEGKKISWRDGFIAIAALLKFRFFN